MKLILGRAASVYILIASIFYWSIDFSKASEQRSRYLLGIFFNGFYKNYYDGIVYFDYMVHSNLQKAVYFANLGECYFQLGSFKKALQFYQEALKREPENILFKRQVQKATEKLQNKIP